MSTNKTENLNLHQWENGFAPNVAEVNENFAALDAAVGRGGAVVRVMRGSYRGGATYGPNNPNTLQFDFMPLLVLITDGSSICMMVRDCTSATSVQGGTVQVTWEDRQVAWYSLITATEPCKNHMNDPWTTYYYMAFGQSA
jgi:hypothetical protein